MQLLRSPLSSSRQLVVIVCATIGGHHEVYADIATPSFGNKVTAAVIAGQLNLGERRQLEVE